jgi:hypothetical protein
MPGSRRSACSAVLSAAAATSVASGVSCPADWRSPQSLGVLGVDGEQYSAGFERAHGDSVPNVHQQVDAAELEPALERLPPEHSPVERAESIRIRGRE